MSAPLLRFLTVDGSTGSRQRAPPAAEATLLYLSAVVRYLRFHAAVGTVTMALHRTHTLVLHGGHARGLFYLWLHEFRMDAARRFRAKMMVRCSATDYRASTQSAGGVGLHPTAVHVGL
jgi:hypothetical protein